MLLGSSQMTVSAQWCLYPFHPYRLQSSFTIITASLTCITRILRFGIKRHPSSSFDASQSKMCQVESISPNHRMPQSNNAHGTIKHRWTKCAINDYNETQNLRSIYQGAHMYRRHDEMMIVIEGKDPPPFGLITPDALSPCLFTLLQQLGREAVNKASSLSTASIKVSAPNVCSLSGPFQTSLWVTIKLMTGLWSWSFGLQEAHKAQSKTAKFCCKRAPYRSV